MWVVRGLSTSDRSGQYGGLHEEQHSVYYDDFFREVQLLDVVLENTETKERVEFESDDMADFSEKIRECNPYGAICCGGTISDDWMFISVDNKSEEFLGYVEGVDLVFQMPTPLRNHVEHLSYALGFWDDMGTLIDSSNEFIKYGFTLFQVICFLNEGWYGSSYYMRGSGCTYRVDFTDVVKARELVEKAVTMGYNPMKNSEDSLIHLRTDSEC